MSDAVKQLKTGDVLQLQYAPPSDNPERYAVRLVGYLPGQSLVITTPRKQGNPILVREGRAFTVRLLHGSNVVAFVAKVLAVATKPFPHLHLTYPLEVESAAVRNAARVMTSLNSFVSKTQAGKQQPQGQPAIVLDLSSTGARVLMHERLGEVGELVKLALSLPVCNGEDDLQVLGTIRNIRESGGGDARASYIYGLSFTGLNRFQQLLLCAYVLGQITDERG